MKIFSEIFFVKAFCMAFLASSAVFTFPASDCLAEKKHYDSNSEQFVGMDNVINNQVKNERKKHHNKKAGAVHKRNHAASALISGHEKDTILEYYRLKRQEIPGGLGKKIQRGGELPPGWQKKLDQGKMLPDSIYQRAEPVPPEITMKFPAMPEGVVLMKVDNKIVKMTEATKTIIDVIDIK